MQLYVLVVAGGPKLFLQCVRLVYRERIIVRKEFAQALHLLGAMYPQSPGRRSRQAKLLEPFRSRDVVHDGTKPFAVVLILGLHQLHIVADPKPTPQFALSILLLQSA